MDDIFKGSLRISSLNQRVSEYDLGTAFLGLLGVSEEDPISFAPQQPSVHRANPSTPICVRWTH